jgi:hypothetical protein
MNGSPLLERGQKLSSILAFLKFFAVVYWSAYCMMLLLAGYMFYGACRRRAGNVSSLVFRSSQIWQPLIAPTSRAAPTWHETLDRHALKPADRNRVNYAKRGVASVTLPTRRLSGAEFCNAFVRRTVASTTETPKHRLAPPYCLTQFCYRMPHNPCYR